MKKTSKPSILKFNKKSITGLNDSHLYSVNGGVTTTTATTATTIINMSKNTLCASDA